MFCKNCWSTEILHDPKPGESRLYRCSRCDSRDVDELITPVVRHRFFVGDPNDAFRGVDKPALIVNDGTKPTVLETNDSLRAAVTSLGNRVAELEAVVERVREVVARTDDWEYVYEVIDAIEAALPPKDERP